MNKIEMIRILIINDFFFRLIKILLFINIKYRKRIRIFFISINERKFTIINQTQLYLNRINLKLKIQTIKTS